MPEKPSPLSKWGAELRNREVLLSVAGKEIVYCFFRFLLDIFWNNAYLSKVS